ncbi:MAG: class I SAM-dependent methyltransferase [Anaerolineae bacterium]|nr:class I SAM-dependent methyltransferase [Anaerolineae bacterium]
MTTTTCERDWYQSDAGLRTRIETHRLYSRVKEPWADWLLSLNEWRGDERVLDVGCGSGALLLPVAQRVPHGLAVGLDYSQAMVERCQAEARAQGIRLGLTRGTALALPFPAATFDVVMANHMLYHVPDIPAALAEAHRVLKPDGLFIAATNGANTMPQIDQVHQAAYARLGLPAPDDYAGHRISTRFNLDSGRAPIEAVFGQVSVVRHADAFDFPTAEPFLRYYATLATLTPDDSALAERLLAAVRDEVEAVIAERGMFTVDKPSGAFVARK